jgi:nuclear pore complex protein Nup98-Nup96
VADSSEIRRQPQELEELEPQVLPRTFSAVVRTLQVSCVPKVQGQLIYLALANPSGGGLFGGGNAPAGTNSGGTPAPPANNLFGSTTGQNIFAGGGASSTGTGNIFGSTGGTQGQNAFGGVGSAAKPLTGSGNLFGNPTVNTNAQAPNAFAGGGTATGQASNPFGGSGSANAQQPNIFGGSGVTNAPAGTGGNTFGSSPNPAAAASTTTNTTTPFGGGLFGASDQANTSASKPIIPNCAFTFTICDIS